ARLGGLGEWGIRRRDSFVRCRGAPGHRCYHRLRLGHGALPEGRSVVAGRRNSAGMNGARRTNPKTIKSMPDSLRIVVTGLAATYPFGGVFWDYIQYVLGFHRLGHDVLYLED